jgi:hypothetical protein
MSSIKQFTYYKNLSSLATIDDTVRFPQSIKFRGINTRKTIRLVSGYCSTEIPNIYNYGSYNNGLVKVTNDGGSTYSSIQLDNGIYTTYDIQQAINYSVSSWHTDVDNDPAFQLLSNDAVGKCYIIIDSTKLALGTQFGVDFSESYIYETLGFVSTKEFLTDGTHEADSLAQLDTFGNLMSIKLNGFGELSIVNYDTSTEIGVIDLTNTNNGNLYRIDSSSTSEIDIYPSKEIQQYSMSFTGSRENRQIVISQGEVKLTFAITEY